MVIGSKGKCIKSLQQEFGVGIRAMKADHQKNLLVPYFLIEGDERSVLFAALKVHSLLSLSMGRSEKELKAENEKLTKDNEELIVVQESCQVCNGLTLGEGVLFPISLYP